MEPAPEWLESTARKAGWRPPRWLIVAVAVVAVLAVSGWYADRGRRAHEESALAGCRQAVHNAAISSDLQLVAVADNLRPSLSAASGPRRARIVAVMSVPARALLPDVAAADRSCRSLRIWPWHCALRARRDAVTAYSAALLGKVRRMAADGGDYYRDDPTLRRLRRSADLGIVGGRY